EADDAALDELADEVVALARALAHAREDRDAAVALREVVDELHDGDGLADAAAPEEAGLAALRVGLEQVDDLDARLEHDGLGRLLLELRRLAMDRQALLRRDGAERVHGIAQHVEHAAEDLATHRNGDGLALVLGVG